MVDVIFVVVMVRINNNNIVKISHEHRPRDPANEIACTAGSRDARIILCAYARLIEKSPEFCG